MARGIGHLLTTAKSIGVRLWGYAAAFGLCGGMVVYSTLFDVGYEEEHMSHWAYAALISGLFLSTLSGESIGQDLALTLLGLFALNIAWRFYRHR